MTRSPIELSPSPLGVKDYDERHHGYGGLRQLQVVHFTMRIMTMLFIVGDGDNEQDDDQVCCGTGREGNDWEQKILWGATLQNCWAG